MKITIKINHLNPYSHKFLRRWKVYEIKGLTRIITWTFNDGEEEEKTTTENVGTDRDK